MILAITIFGLAAATALSVFRNRSWPAELLTHLRPQMIVASVALGAIALFLGDWPLASIALGVGLLNWALLPTRKWLKPDGALAEKPGLTIVWANLWKKHGALERTVKWASAQNADLILLSEFPSGDVNDPALAPDYPYRLDGLPGGSTENWCSRVVALSKLPLLDAEVIPAPSGYARPFLAFGIEAPGQGRISIYPVHPTAPMAPRLQHDRDATVAKISETVKHPFLIAGDFNATPWCAVFSTIPGQRVGDFRPTWLTNLPLLGLAIDHIMVSPGIKPSLYRVGPFLGSDHRPLLARVHGFGADSR